MFDGIDDVIVVTTDLAHALDLYRDHLEFEETARAQIDDDRYHRLWRLPAGPLDVVLLEKRGSAGGALRLVGAPALAPVSAPRTLHRSGPFAIDFYVRDLPTLHDRLLRDGYRFRSPPQRYPLFGTDFTVDEVLLEAPEGFVHALIEYLPRQHRCVLAARDDLSVSEAVAAITVVDEVAKGLRLLRDVLGGEVYFDQRFEGPVIETLVGLPSGSSFRATLLRGPTRRNARAELMEVVPAADPAAVDPPRDHPRMLLGCVVGDLDALAARMTGDPAWGRFQGPFLLYDPLHGRRRFASLETPWGAFLEFRDQLTRR